MKQSASWVFISESILFFFFFFYPFLDISILSRYKQSLILPSYDYSLLPPDTLDQEYLHMAERAVQWLGCMLFLTISQRGFKRAGIRSPLLPAV